MNGSRIADEFLAKEMGVDYDVHTSDSILLTREDFEVDKFEYDEDKKMNKELKQKIIDEIENTINENKDSFYGVVSDIKSGHFDFPPECILVQLDLLFEELKERILKI